MLIPASLSKTTLSPILILTGRRRFKSCDHTEDRRLSASGRSKQCDEGVIRDIQVQMIDPVKFPQRFVIFLNVISGILVSSYSIVKACTCQLID